MTEHNKVNSSGTDIIFAAGGIVWRHKPEGPEIAIIHRTRYGNEWCLPKGKPKPHDKGLDDTAIREVREETGCEVETLDFIGTTNYISNGKPKVVFYWNTKIVGDCTFKPSKEVDKIVWLTPDKAVKRLSHAEEKDLIATKILYGRRKPSIFCRFVLTDEIRSDRLAGSLSAYRPEIEYRISKAIGGSQPYPDWAKALHELLDNAERALRENKIDEGWRCFHAAQRMEIFGLTDVELQSKADLLRMESEKLSSWRKKGTNKLLGTAESPNSNVSHENVYRAALLRDEYYNNQAYKDGLLRDHVNVLVLFLLVTLTTLMLLFKRSGLAPDGYMLYGVLLFGLLGAVVSAMLKVPSSNSSRIPEQVQAHRLTMLRVSMGAACALIIYVFAKSALSLKLLGINVSDYEAHTYYAVSFVAGFGERLVLKAVELVAEKK
jgi:8-oxo-dGTP pyrophosphatase MutT (NUDIX family)